MVGCACAAPSGGCTAPWAAKSASQQATPAVTAIPDTATKIAPAAALDTSESQPDFAGVLDKLQQVRAIDPSAEQRLVDELRRTPHASWPLVAEQFRASLAYHEQLADKRLARRREGAPSGEQRFLDDDAAPAGNKRASIVPAKPNDVTRQPLAVDRPSAPIGTLVDPRSADADDESIEALAATTPYSTPVPLATSGRPEPYAPRPFESDGAPQAIASAAAMPTVEQVRLEVADESLVEQLAVRHEGAPLPARSRGAEVDWQQLIERAADELGQNVVTSPSTTAEVHQHVSLRMLHLIAGDTEMALEPIPHITPVEQDFWSRQMFALATYLDHHSQPDDKRRAAASVTHLDEAVSHLRELGSLSLRNLSFCKQVFGYGSIEPFHTDVFSPGQQLSLYVEVENYHSSSTEKGYCTLLGSTYEILDEDGKRVGGSEFPDVDDCCHNRRRDFHIQYGLSLPEKLAPGRYRLQLVVKDRQSDKRATATVEFEIRGSGSRL
jgi:hypothetical protein